MLVYLAPLLAICPLYAFLRKKENGERIILIIVSCYIFLLLAFRSVNSGVDLTAYQGMFNIAKDFSFKEMIDSFSLVHSTPGLAEWGYGFLNWLFAKAGLGFRAFLIFQSLFCVGSAYYFVDRNSVRPALSIALLIGFGFIDYTYCIVRQAMSLAFLLFATDFLKRRQIIPTLLFTLLAILMHRTAALFIVAIPLSFIPINRVTVTVYCVFSLLLIPLFPVLYNSLLQPVFSLFSKTGYLRRIDFELKEMLVGVLAIALFLVFFADTEKLKGGKNGAFFWTFMLALPLESISLYVPILSRVTTLTFLPFASVAIPNLMETNENKKAVLIFEILVYIAAIGYYIIALKYDKRMLCMIPYKLFFKG